MVAELYRYSDRPDRMELFPRELRDYHKTRSKHKRRRQDPQAPGTAGGATTATSWQPTHAGLAVPAAIRNTSVADLWGEGEPTEHMDAEQDEAAQAHDMFSSIDADQALLDAAGF